MTSRIRASSASVGSRVCGTSAGTVSSTLAVRPVVVKERVTVGATLPADVELLSVPADWGPSVTKYRYVYHDNNVVLVEPSSRRVVRIID